MKIKWTVINPKIIILTLFYLLPVLCLTGCSQEPQETRNSHEVQKAPEDPVKDVTTTQTQPFIASDWPQYLGPDRNAVSGEKGLLKSWPAEGPKVLWTVPLGEGFGGAAISEGKVYVYDRVDKKTNVLRCLDLMTGKEEWTFSNEAPGSFSFDGSRSIPTIDGNKIYICDLVGNLNCVDKITHKSLWRKNIWTDFGGTDLPKWAIAQNPLIYQNMVIVASQTEEAGIVAYDKENGNIIWKTPRLPGCTGFDAGYVSPAIMKISGEDHLIMVTAASRDGSIKGAVLGYNPENGNLLLYNVSLFRKTEG